MSNPVVRPPCRGRFPSFEWSLRWLSAFGLLLLALGFTAAQALSESDFLPPEDAFRMSAQMVEPDVLEVRYDIADGYYMYHEQFRFTAEPVAEALGEAQIPPGQVIYDQVFEKDLETHRDAIAIRIPLQTAPQGLTVQAVSQGCADAGLCYPPQSWPIELNLQGGGWSAQAATIDSGWGGGSSAGFGNWRTANDLGLADALAGAALWQTVGVFFVLGVLLSLTPCVLPMIPILSSLLVGDQAAQQARGQVSGRGRGLALAATYTLGMSIVYTAAGVAAGLTGASLAATLQTPWVLSVFAVLLGLLALAMFGVFTLQVPKRWQLALTQQVNRLPGGRFTGAFGVGAISALIVGPCVAAPLAGALLYISQTGDVWLGGMALFAMSWGMGVSLLVAGASASTLLPKAGPWMQGIQHFFGVLLLVVAWWMLLPVLPGWLAMVGWALLAFFAASLLRAFEAVPAGGGVGARLGKAAGLVLALVGTIQLVGVASGGRDALQPLAHWSSGRDAGPPTWAPVGDGAALSQAEVPGAAGSPPQGTAGALFGQAAPDSSWLTNGTSAASGGAVAEIGAADFASGQAGSAAATSGPGLSMSEGVWVGGATYPPFRRVESLTELDALIGQVRGRPVMLDFYADWCVSCKEMERFTFSDPAVAQRMARMVLIQADVTANTDEHRELLRRFRLFGPPGIIFFDEQGREQTDTRVVGFQNARRFGAVLDQVLAGSAS